MDTTTRRRFLQWSSCIAALSASPGFGGSTNELVPTPPPTYQLLARDSAASGAYAADTGRCVIVNSLGNNPGSDGLAYSPDYDAKLALVPDGSPLKLAELSVRNITIRRQPAHGNMTPFVRGPGDAPGFLYNVTRGYFGTDTAEFVVELSNGKKVLVRYLMSVVDGRDDQYPECPVPPSTYKQLHEQYRPTKGGNADGVVAPRGPPDLPLRVRPPEGDEETSERPCVSS